MEGREIKEIESHIVLGYSCNHYCKHCVVQVKRLKVKQSRLSSDLSPGESVMAVKQAIDNGATKIVFTGGEPTLRPDLPDLVNLSLSMGCMVQIQTNGSRPKMVECICRDNMKIIDRIEFMIPIHSSNQKHNDFICGCEGGFEDALNSIDCIMSHNGNLIGKIVLTQYTVDLPAICRLYERKRAKYLIIAYPHCVSFPVELIRRVDLEKQQSKDILQELYHHSFELPIILQAFPHCFIGDIPDAVIQEEQPDFLGLQIVEHKLKSEIPLAWHTYRKLDKRKFNYCNTCMYDKQCEGIWKDYIKAYGD